MSCLGQTGAGGTAPSLSLGGTGGSCLVADTACIDFIGSSYRASTQKAACEAQSVVNGTVLTYGTWSASACNTTGELGTCTVAAGTSQEFLYHYIGSDWTLSGAQSDCSTQGGTFAAG